MPASARKLGLPTFYRGLLQFGLRGWLVFVRGRSSVRVIVCFVVFCGNKLHGAVLRWPSTMVRRDELGRWDL